MDEKDVNNFNEVELKRILIDFERKHHDNQKLRIKYADDPNKFATSETELFAALDQIQKVATQPELYPVLVAKGTLSTLLSLIGHENTDISAEVIGILRDLTDLDDSEDAEKSVAILIGTLSDNNMIDLIVSNLSRLDKTLTDELQAINDSLTIIDNLIEYDHNTIGANSEKLINWMIITLKVKLEFEAIKLPIAELLAILLTISTENKLFLNQANGIDVLLQQVAYYRRIAPQTGDEHEFLEQIVNCLCTALFDCDDNRESFFKEEGVDLVELLLREKREAIKKSNLKLAILKLFNHVLTTDKNQDEVVTKCCERFIEVLGLRVIFPLFNNPKLVLNEKLKRREYQQFLDEVEEHTSAIVLALLKNSQNTEHIQRMLVKFAENKFEKFRRVLSLHEKYFIIVQTRKTSAEESMEQTSSVYFALRTIDYILLLVAYLTSQFETYDPTSGETFTNFLPKALAERPQLRHQIVMGTRTHIDEVAHSKEECETLNFLLEHFKTLGKLA